MTAERIATVATAFSADGIHVQSLKSSEELGRPFHFEVELLCEENNLDLNDQLGKSMTVTVDTRNGGQRHFDGLVSEITFAGSRGHLSRYKATLRPWLSFLEHTSDNRVFQEKSVPDILTAVFDLHGQSCRKSLNSTYNPREYCVQYGESDFDFVSRLMEEEGIYYFFEHSKGKHDLVLADSSNAHEVFDEYAKIQFFPPDQGQRDEDHISHWELSHSVETQKFAVDSYNYETPDADLAAKKEIKQKHALSGKEQYEYGQLYPKKADGTKISQVRVEEQQVNYAMVTGAGNVRGVSCGSLFELENSPREDQNKKYLVVGVSCQVENSDIEAGDEGGDASFTCAFRAIDEKTPFRPARATPKGLVRGPQTAVVVGPSGEEIYTDKYGRVKVQFFWDRLGKVDENSSCWVRVSTGIAGKKWGMVALPRIGQEVIVDFLEGDPDQPIITGSVYNDGNMPPYALPDNQTQSGFKSRSSKKGNDNNFNEMRFEDKKGAEEVYLHAERDFRRVVENDDSLTVGLETKDKGDQTIEIYNDRTATLNEGNDTLTVAKGNQTVKVKKKIYIEAGDEFKVKVGLSTLTMKKNGEITIKGKDIKITGSMSVVAKGGTKAELLSDVNVKIEGGVNVDITAGVAANVKGTMTTVEGSGVLDLKAGGMAKLKGGVTMIG